MLRYCCNIVINLIELININCGQEETNLLFRRIQNNIHITIPSSKSRSLNSLNFNNLIPEYGKDRGRVALLQRIGPNTDPSEQLIEPSFRLLESKARG